MATSVETIQAALDAAKENGAGGDAAFGWVSSVAFALAAEIDFRMSLPPAVAPVVTGSEPTKNAAPAV
jgi:hypothetical protein